MTNKFILILLLLSNSLVFSSETYKTENIQDISLSIGSAALFGTGYYLESAMDALSEADIEALDKNDINPLDRFAADYYNTDIATGSDIGLSINLMAPLMFAFDPDAQDELYQIGLMYYQTFMLTNALTSLTKYGFQRIRPYAYNDEAPLAAKLNAETKKSFFSGHTSNAFASAVFFAKVYSDLHPESKYNSYIWAGSLTVATATGLFRIFAGKHFPTDVLAGAVIGGLTGYIIPGLHKNENRDYSVGLNRSMISFSFVF